MTKKRVFTDEELKEMGRRTLDVLLEAIDTDNKEKAKELANRMYQESRGMHDMMCVQLTGLMSYIYETHGEEDFYHAIRRMIGSYSDERAEQYAKADFRQRVEIRAAGLRGHLEPMTVVEDDEKICMRMEPCGSGEMLVKEGNYGPPRNFAMIQKAHPMTYNMNDFPIYCTHAPIIELLWIEKYGEPACVVYPAEKMARGGCWYCLYKDPKYIPDEVYERVGREKPKQKE